VASLDDQNAGGVPAFLGSTSAMGAAMRGFDWASSPLGEPERWPVALKTLVQILLTSKQPMFLVWGKERIWLYNDAFIPIAGKKHPGALGRPSHEVWAEAWSQTQPMFDRVFAGEATHVTDFVMGLDRIDAIKEAHFDFSHTPVFGDAQTVEGLFGICVETTERIEGGRAELATVREERGRIFEMSRDLFATATYDGFLTSINPAWSRQLGRPDHELLAKPFADIIHPDDLAETGNVVAALRSGQPVHQFHVRLLRADGRAIAFAWSAVPDVTPGSRIFYTVGRDISEEIAAAAELHAAQEALRQSQKMEAVGQLTGGIAHDFNNLLAGIAGSLELLAKRLAQGRSDGVERYIHAAQSSTQRAAALTHRLLAFSRRQTLDPKPTDINRLMVDMCDLIRGSVGPSVHVDVIGANDLWLTKVDPSQLESALLNLAINARDAMPEGGRITVEAANRSLDARAAMERDIFPGDYISLCVSDTGTGMSAEVKSRAFDPFFTTKPLGQGTGLGLSMVHGFARQSGGQVRIHSMLGSGTTIWIYLPRFRGTLDVVEEAREAAAPLQRVRGETVLVIDDEAPIRMLLRDALEDAGYHVLLAADGPSGLAVLDSGVDIDFLITDVGLPGGLNGRQVADAARVNRKDLKVLFVTGYAENAAVGNGHLEAGMGVLTKPFELSVLLNRVSDMIAAPGPLA